MHEVEELNKAYSYKPKAYRWIKLARQHGNPIRPVKRDNIRAG
ncbi:hypothetical protein H1P_590017 [Hyella patelloides LEGE 07179]|uniref:Uncharacterized protein n=1 Tax=Hyella patelloides LEGE 07179 TaxID=945734 RepID=A0A563W106_9CYAN|nr:hypothetical protein [Hyella patelloides]VEP17325.1 hypothetical protein H1P_590017 [Hyella patelloides LEGE 07179]